MKANDLNRALNYVEDRYLAELDAPEQECIPMKNRKRIVRLLVAAAVIALLSVTAYAADVFGIRSLESGGKSTQYSSFAEMDKAMAQAGFQADCKEEFSNGFRFANASVDETVGRDENGKKALVYQELSVTYKNDAGQRVMFYAHRDLEDIPQDDHPAQNTWDVQGITVNYYLDHYKFVPADYKLSEEEQVWQEIPGNYISFGSDQVEEKDVAFLGWIKDGIRYTIMDSFAQVPVESLYSMAQELIAQ